MHCICLFDKFVEFHLNGFGGAEKELQTYNKRQEIFLEKLIVKFELISGGNININHVFLRWNGLFFTCQVFLFTILQFELHRQNQCNNNNNNPKAMRRRPRKSMSKFECDFTIENNGYSSA